jgi:hypothetical protein
MKRGAPADKSTGRAQGHGRNLVDKVLVLDGNMKLKRTK